MKLIDIRFSVNDYDEDGDVCATGIFLHFGETRLKVADDMDEFLAVATRIVGMIDEVAINYANKAKQHGR
ncbi:MAG: hypothetical protein ABIK92_21935 [Pseudomonadota bacterium]